MKIAFLGNANGGSGVTSNLACISIISALEYASKAVLMENHNQKNKLENVLQYNMANYHLREEFNYHYKHIGMNYIINQLSKKNSLAGDESASQLIQEASIEILNNYLYYIPQTHENNSYIYDYDLYGHIHDILKALDDFADITYIDTSSSNNLSTKIILDSADLIVVNLMQNVADIEYFFKNYSSILSKCVFLISSYHKESRLNIHNISKKNLISKSSIAAIPYNVEYQDAVLKGTIVEFLFCNFACKRSSPNYSFVRAVRKAAYMIMQNINSVRQKEACQ